LTEGKLAKSLAKRLGPNVHVAEEPVGGVHGLLGDESDAVARAISKRQSEFAAGRRAARSALSALGLGPKAIPAGADRAPIWPNGAIGSITHDQGLALAAVAETRDVRALGIDLTEASPLPGDVRRLILRAKEDATLNDLEARAAFAVKECIFKALHPEVKSFFGFDAAFVKPDLAAGSFSAKLTVDLGPHKEGAMLGGVLHLEDDRLVAVLVLREN